MRQSQLLATFITVFALMLSVGGCKKEDAADSSAPDANAGGGIESSAAAESPDEINLFAWSEYVPQSVIDGFHAQTGIRVNYETYASNEEMLAKLIAGGTKYDLIQPSEYTIEALVKANRLAELNWDNIPNFKYIDPKLKSLGHDPQQKYAVPYMSGTVGIVVNTEKVSDPIKGYVDVFQEKYKGRIVVLDDNREIVSWALSAQGIDVNDISKANLDKVRPLIQKWIPLIKVYDSDSPKTALLNGDCDLGIVWSGEAALLYQEDKKFKYVLPAEGAHLFIDSLCIPRDAPNQQAAERFINYCLRPEVSKLISDDFPYTNPNLEARKLLSTEQLENPASYPPGDPKLGIFRDIGEMSGEIDQMMTDLRG